MNEFILILSIVVVLPLARLIEYKKFKIHVRLIEVQYIGNIQVVS